MPLDRLNFAELGALTFEPADEERFPSLRLSKEVMDTGGLAGAVFNGAKECALDEFLSGSIGFLDMARLVTHVMAHLSDEASRIRDGYGLDDVLALDSQARSLGREWASGTDKRC